MGAIFYFRAVPELNTLRVRWQAHFFIVWVVVCFQYRWCCCLSPFFVFYLWVVRLKSRLLSNISVPPTTPTPFLKFWNSPKTTTLNHDYAGNAGIDGRGFLTSSTLHCRDKNKLILLYCHNLSMTQVQYSNKQENHILTFSSSKK